MYSEKEENHKPYFNGKVFFTLNCPPVNKIILNTGTMNTVDKPM